MKKSATLSGASSEGRCAVRVCKMFYLEPFILKHLLDGHQLSRVTELGLVDNTERAVADDFGVRVAHLLRPVGTLAWSGHDCRYLAAIFIP